MIRNSSRFREYNNLSRPERTELVSGHGFDSLAIPDRYGADRHPANPGETSGDPGRDLRVRKASGPGLYL